MPDYFVAAIANHGLRFRTIMEFKHQLESILQEDVKYDENNFQKGKNYLELSTEKWAQADKELKTDDTICALIDYDPNSFNCYHYFSRNCKEINIHSPADDYWERFIEAHQHISNMHFRYYDLVHVKRFKGDTLIYYRTDTPVGDCIGNLFWEGKNIEHIIHYVQSVFGNPFPSFRVAHINPQAYAPYLITKTDGINRMQKFLNYKKQKGYYKFLKFE